MEGRQYIVEDYPFFSEVLARGNCDNDVFYAYNTSFPISLETSPKLRDYPSHEGFGVVVVASLMRKENKIFDFDYIVSIDKKNNTRVPVINATAKDVIDNILSKGPSDIAELLVLVQEYLESRSETDLKRLPAMLEPLGWSYNGTGVIVDGNKKPMEKCAVQSISYIGKDEEYRTLMSAYTGKDGKFLLNRIFPGCSIIRVFYNYDGARYKDSVDYPLEIDWNRPTNQQVNLGNLTINNSDVLNSLKKCNQTTGYGNISVVWSNGQSELWNPFLAFRVTEPVTWNGTNFTFFHSESESGSWPSKLEYKVTGSIDEKTNLLKEYNFEYYYEMWDSQAKSYKLITRSFKIKNIPYTSGTVNSISFELAGSDLSNNISELKVYQSIYDPSTKKYTETSAKSVDYKSLKKITVSFSII